MITKTASVLNLQVIQDQRPCDGVSFVFFRPDEEEELKGNPLPRYDMSIEKWEEMGKPYVITLTAEPGDTLNKDE